MSESGTGIIFTQDGVSVDGSADYQRVFDSRTKYVEVEFEREFKLTIPSVGAVDSTARYHDRIDVYRHGLGFVPAFETDFNYDELSLYADEQYFFILRLVSYSGVTSQSLVFNIRCYNLSILDEYIAEKGLPLGTQSARSTSGVKFLDSNSHGVDIGDNSPVGFSVDSSKKILAIHRTGLAKINDWNGHYCLVSDIDTSSDTLTIYADPSATYMYQKDISWMQESGTLLTYMPGDHSTYPGGITAGQSLYVIPVDETHIKLAASYTNALSRVSIDLTSSGSLPGRLTAQQPSDTLSNAIYHDVGYPPTFMLAPVYREMFMRGVSTETDNYIGPLVDVIKAYVTADDTYLYFKGVQSVFSGWYGYIVLKDPAELAR